MTLGNRLREERVSQGLSQRELADHCGIGANAQGHYEIGLRFPRADYLQSLAVKGLDVLYILTGRRIPIEASSISDEEHMVMVAIRALSTEDQMAFQQIMDSLVSKSRN